MTMLNPSKEIDLSKLRIKKQQNIRKWLRKGRGLTRKYKFFEKI
jgi:hypothetical protein